MSKADFEPDNGTDTRFILMGWILLLLAAILFLSGCKSIEYVPVERKVTEIRYRDSIRTDSIHVRDSVYVEVRGDTVNKHVERSLFRYVYLTRTDTVSCTDTIRVTRTERVEVEKPRKWYDTALLWYGRVAFAALLVFIIIIIAQFRINSKRE